MNTNIIKTLLNKLYKFFMSFIFVIILAFTAAALFYLKSHFINTINFFVYIYLIYVYIRWIALRYQIRIAGASYVYGMLSCASIVVCIRLLVYFTGKTTFPSSYTPVFLGVPIGCVLFWWLGNIFGRVRKRLYNKMLKMKEQIDYETENWESIVAELASDKPKAFIYWYRKPLLVLKGLSGWPMKIKPPSWMLAVVWAELLGVVIIANCWVRAVLNPMLTDQMLLQLLGTIIVQSAVISIPILLLLLFIMYLRRNQKPSSKLELDESVEETPLQQYKRILVRVRRGV